MIDFNALDEFETNILRNGNIVAQYYKGLMREGIPHKTAEILTLNFSDNLWKMLFKPDQPETKNG